MTGISHAVADWGTTSFRLWALDRAGRVLGECRSSDGLTTASLKGFETVLEAHLRAVGVPAGVPVMLCGMVGSRTGWVEAAYLDAPLRLDHLAERATPVPARLRPVRILPGVAQRDAGRPDVMRGEETQLLALSTEGFSGLACLPGTHSKWVRLEGGVITSFATFLTGELFHLVRTSTVISPALAEAAPVDPVTPAFAEGVADALEHPEDLSNRLFELRARWLLEGPTPTASLARLSGLVIGLELAGARAHHGDLDGAVLIASGATARLYAQALAVAGARGVPVRDADGLVRAGLHAAAIRAFDLAAGDTP